MSDYHKHLKFISKKHLIIILHFVRKKSQSLSASHKELLQSVSTVQSGSCSERTSPTDSWNGVHYKNKG
jgi:hypothetical protein